LSVEPDNSFCDSIVVSRSERYRNCAISYKFLSAYPKVIFVGVEEEYKDFITQVPHAEWARVNDFLQLARIIAGSRLFIGNQSFPFAIAEALKVPRVVELDPLTPNVVPVGDDGYDVLFQRQFEYVVRNYIERHVSANAMAWKQHAGAIAQLEPIA
jgi:ADP-heptose:LPS heptosyltransferase